MSTKITFSNSEWSKTFYPDSMFRLPVRVRKKAIEIGNSLIGDKDTDTATREAIIRAKAWAQGMGFKMELKEKKPRKRTGELHFRRKGKNMIPDIILHKNN